MNNKRTIFISLTLLAATLACAIPAIPGVQTAPPNPPTVDTNILSTMVAQTVDAAIVLTEQAMPTATIVPTETPTLPPTSTPTFQVVPSGSTRTIQEDGSTIFVDERAGFEVAVPTGWLALRVSEQEFLDAFTSLPTMQPYLMSIQNNDPNIFRLFALDTQDGHVQEDFFTNISFVWDEQGFISLDTDADLKISAFYLTETTPGLEVLSTTLLNTSNKVSLGLIETKSIMKNSSNTDVTVFQKQAIFNAKTGKMTVTVSTIEALKDETFSAFDAMLETIKLSVE